MKSKYIVLISIFSIIFVKTLQSFLPKNNPIIIIVSIGSILSLALIIMLIIYIRFRKNESNIAFGKKIIFKGVANNYTTGGYLILTTEDLIFKAHILNAQRYTLRISIKDIVDIKPIELTTISKGILITDNTTVHQFLVYKRDLWIEHIEKLMKKI